MLVSSPQRNRRQTVFLSSYPPMAAVITLFGTSIIGAERQSTRIEIQVISTPKAGPLASQEWLAVLRKLPLDSVRIRNGSGQEKPLIERDAGTIRVTGVLSTRNELLFPGKRFSRRDQAGLANWLDELANGQGTASARSAFGLTPEQLVAVRDAFKSRVPSSTADRQTADVVDELVKLIDLPITISVAARAGVNADFVITDELRGLASGTALAAALRPVGLVFYPRDDGKSLTIAAVNEYQQAWPIGWPAEKTPQNIAPTFFRKLEIEIVDTSLTDVVTSLRQRMDMPIIFDHNGMARQRIEPKDMRISLPKRRTFYKRALDLALRQAKLRAELRVDENDRPFIWVAPKQIRRDDRP